MKTALHCNHCIASMQLTKRLISEDRFQRLKSQKLAIIIRKIRDDNQRQPLLMNVTYYWEAGMASYHLSYRILPHK